MIPFGAKVRIIFMRIPYRKVAKYGQIADDGASQVAWYLGDIALSLKSLAREL